MHPAGAAAIRGRMPVGCTRDRDRSNRSPARWSTGSRRSPLVGSPRAREAKRRPPAHASSPTTSSGHVRVSARSLDAPLLVVLVGPTGAGKSTLFNTIAGQPASETGVIRPTTRVAIALGHPDDLALLRDGAFARIPSSQLRDVAGDTLERGLVLSTPRTSIRSSTRTVPSPTGSSRPPISASS